MEYIGIQSQKNRNNRNSIFLLVLFPVLLLLVFWVITYFIDQNGEHPIDFFTQVAPFVLVGTGFWFLIAWSLNTQLIQWATGAKPLERTENKRVYNVVENLCIANGIQMPNVFVIEDDSLNAFASGIDKRSFSVTLSRGLINKLKDDELEGVVAHELSHIRNRDTRLLIISIIFVGVFSFLAEMAFRSIRFSGRKSDKGVGLIILVAVVVSGIAYFLALLMRFGISRSREYMADAGAAEMTKNPRALASALKKISDDPLIEAVQSRDVAQLFINNPAPSQHRASWDNLFSTHPPIEKRIEYLNQFV
ncbi:MAG TPA: M48 family metallopeptidase [Bacteroidia bacterium]|nr:M48 family metallopeptidase [Bacteroidia bacterium]